MQLMAGDFRLVFWIAIIPGKAAVLVHIFFVKEPEHQLARPPKMKLERAPLRVSKGQATAVFTRLVAIAGWLLVQRIRRSMEH